MSDPNNLFRLPWIWKLNAFLLRRVSEERRKHVRDMMIEDYVVKKGIPYAIAAERVDTQFAMMGVYNADWK